MPERWRRASRREVKPGGNTIVRLDLLGLVDLDSTFEESDLLEELASDYFHVAIRRRGFHVASADADLSELPERFVIGRFARILRDQLGAVQGDGERQDVEDALKLGVALLQGKDVIA